MITLYDGERITTRIQENKINYASVGENNTLIINSITGTIILRHSTLAELHNSIFKISNSLRKYLATFGTLTTVMLLNVANVSSYNQSNGYLNITFQSSDVISMEFHSDYELQNNYDYFHNIYLSANLQDYIQDKTKHYVNPSYQENLTQRKYATWTRALQYANANDVVILEKATYRNLEVLLKDGVDTVMQDCFFDNVGTNNRATIMDSISLGTNPVDCKIFGNGIFSYKNPLRENHWLTLDIHSTSNVYFEFDSCYSEDAGATSFLHQWYGKMWAKGNLFYSEKTRTYDSESITEGIPLLFDNDIACHITESGSIMYVPFSGYTTDYYFRNVYMENNGEGDSHYAGHDMLSMQESSLFNCNMIASKFNVRQVYDGVTSSYVLVNSSSQITEVSAFRIWMSNFYNINETQKILSVPLGTEVIPIKTVLTSVANLGSEVTFELPSLYTIDNDFTIDRLNFLDIVFSNSYFLKHTGGNILANYDKQMLRKEYSLINLTANNNLLTAINTIYSDQSTIITDKYSTKYLINIDEVREIFKETISNRIFVIFDNYELWFETVSASLDSTYTTLVNLKNSWETLKMNFNDI